MNEYKYKNGDLIEFENGVIKGKGNIKGVAVIPAPVIGTGYIVEYTELSIEFPYSCIVVFENQIL